MLEIGYGSGVFQYELGRRAQLSVGIDPHPHAATVHACLRKDGLSVEVLRGDGAALPFADATFDAVVVVSALEFIADPTTCLAECRRILRPGGRLVCIIPRQLPWADAVFRTLTGHDPEADFGGARAKVQAALAQAAPDAQRQRIRRCGGARTEDEALLGFVASRLAAEADDLPHGEATARVQAGGAPAASRRAR